MRHGNKKTGMDSYSLLIWEGERSTHIQAIKEIIFPSLVLHEQFNILVHSLLYWDRVEVTDGIFTQEIKLDNIVFAIFLRVKSDVLHS